MHWLHDLWQHTLWHSCTSDIEHETKRAVVFVHSGKDDSAICVVFVNDGPESEIVSKSLVTKLHNFITAVTPVLFKSATSSPREPFKKIATQQVCKNEMVRSGEG